MFLKKIFRSENSDLNRLPTIFHITHYKAGSQWVYAILNEVAGKRIVKPLVAADHVTRQPIIKGMVYPCVYLARDELFRAKPPEKSRIFIVIRDLRDTLVSQYYNERYSHTILDPAMQQSRDALSSMSLADGLVFIMRRHLNISAGIQRSWINSGHMLVRYEDLNKDAYTNFQKIFAHCSIDVDENEINGIIDRYSFEKQAGRKRGEENINSHHRKGIVGDWRNYFDQKLTREFKDRYGDMLIKTGYENDMNWQP